MRRVEVGDWISFYRNGSIKFSEVRYIRSLTGIGTEFCTNDGAVSLDAVLEVRGAESDDTDEEIG